MAEIPEFRKQQEDEESGSSSYKEHGGQPGLHEALSQNAKTFWLQSQIDKTEDILGRQRELNLAEKKVKVHRIKWLFFPVLERGFHY